MTRLTFFKKKKLHLQFNHQIRIRSHKVINKNCTNRAVFFFFNETRVRAAATLSPNLGIALRCDVFTIRVCDNYLTCTSVHARKVIFVTNAPPLRHAIHVFFVTIWNPHWVEPFEKRISKNEIFNETRLNFFREKKKKSSTILMITQSIGSRNTLPFLFCKNDA